MQPRQFSRQRVETVPPRRQGRGRARAIRRSLRGNLDRGFRPDVEGMRAVAVVAVIAYHTRIPGFNGGFVGVGVFFVLSGFLITRLVLGELAATGTISLPAFWARRARRLLPAAALTVVVTVVLAQRMLPPLSLPSLATDTVAAGTFSANFVFAHRLGDYFGAQLGPSNPSPLLHFWSLAVEEQFYLCWPPLLVLLTRRPAQYRRLLLAVAGVLGVTGFAIGWWLSSSRPALAFYLLPARMGELLVGAALAGVGTGIAAIAPARRALLGWAGPAAIAVACFAFDESVPWPGVAVVLPVFGTAAVIVAGWRVVTGTPVGPGWPRWPGRASPRPLGVATAVDRPSFLRVVPLALVGLGAGRSQVGAAHWCTMGPCDWITTADSMAHH